MGKEERDLLLAKMRVGLPQGSHASQEMQKAGLRAASPGFHLQLEYAKATLRKRADGNSPKHKSLRGTQISLEI